MKKIYSVLTLVLIVSFAFQANSQPQSKEIMKAEKVFNENAKEALALMKKASEDMGVQGVAMVFFIPGDQVASWSSQMVICGVMSNERQNYLSIANSKAAEMAETLKDSGTTDREPKTGEFGWKGGVIKKIASGYLLATFSGATEAQDVEIAKKGLELLSQKI